MTSIPPDTRAEDGSSSRPNTPSTSQSSLKIVVPNVAVEEPSTVVLLPEESGLSPAANDLLLPIPTLLMNKPHVSFTLPDIINDSNELELLSTELATAEVSVAPDGSFVEMSSGPAARELKKHWDHNLGVGKSVRSPYAITAFVNQHGKQMFRVGRRELSAPAATAVEIEERISQSTSPSEPSNSPRTQRRSRMSVHALPSMFKNGSISSGSRPPLPILQASAPRKLRKTRSIPDLVSMAANDTSSQGTSAAGRTHSRSVTGADVFPFSTTVHSDPHTGDLFGEFMDWMTPATPATSCSTHSLQASNGLCDHLNSPAAMAHPFGHGVVFNSPSRRTPVSMFLPPPATRFLREVQSFESGLTAKQADPPKRIGRESSITSECPDDADTGRPPSALRLYPSSSSMRRVEATPEFTFTLSPETALLSRYSTDVFDVLQTYRGLPLLDKLSLEPEETTVKMSLSADDSAAPRDDPRFVIWGEIQVERNYDEQSASHDSVTDLSVHSSLSKRRLSRVKASDASSLLLPLGEDTKKTLIAATIERWIAQLTSDLNYDELLDFFLTYRTYISTIDLCHLLICRFHWALQPATFSRDERVRQIVRVRTFVAIRYWLLTFFTVDFLPNRELRLLIANWLNTLIRDPVLKKHNDGLGIVRKLIKVVKECKRAHTRSTTKSKPRPLSQQRPAQTKKAHLLGEHFAAAIQKSAVEDEDSDVDLDFLPDEGTPSSISHGFPHDPANAHLTNAHIGAGLSPTRPTSIPFSSFSILQRTDHAPGPGPEPDMPLVQNPATLPMHHSAFSRAFVKTIGRLGRWKRVLNSRATARTSLGACADVSAFDLELGNSKDVLTVNGGVEQYLKRVEPSPRVPPPTSLHISETKNSPPVTEHHPSQGSRPSGDIVEAPLHHVEPVAHEPSLPISQVPETAVISKSPEVPVDPVQDDRALSLRSSSTDSFGTPLTSGGPPPSFPPLARPQWQFDIVSIDDLDLSDTSSDYHEVGPVAPPGLRRLPRKLPLRRDFEFVRRSDTVSSMGLTSRDSMASNRSSAVSSSSATGFGGNVAQWQLNALIDSLSDDEETGDREDAMRRLEGQINPEKQQEKASKVDGWVRTIQERMAAGDYHDEPPLFSDDDEDEDLEDESYEPKQGQGSDSFSDRDSINEHPPAISAPFISESEGHDDSSGADEMSELINTPIPTHTTHVIPPPGLGSPTRSPDAKPVPEDAVPLEILQSRMPSRPSTSSSHRPSLSRFAVNPEAPSIHRSFIMNYRAAILAEHFAMIDRELFMGVKFEELVLDDWMGCKEVDVLDWAQYLKDRARWKAESRFPDKTSALGAVRARFNLMANFTISEIVLTQPNERPVLVAKFIRIAWKAYRMCNFSTLAAIIAGLQNNWVTKAMRRPGWSRVGIWENRVFKDLKLFTTSDEDFKHLRQTVASIVDAKPLDANSHATSVVSGGGTDTQSGKNKTASEWSVPPTACIPFIGVYLSQLQRHSRLPDLIDPTAPEHAVGINPITSTFDAPAHPEVFSALAPLPPSMHLEPLINVHKQRRIARVIKALVAGQHLASRLQFEVDRKLFQKCLRLRGLNTETLQRALAVYPE